MANEAKGVVSVSAQRMFERLLDATLASIEGVAFTTTEAARAMGLDNVPRAAHLVGELHRAGLLVAGEKLVARDGGPGYRSAVAWRVSRLALIREMNALRRRLWQAEHPAEADTQTHQAGRG